MPCSQGSRCCRPWLLQPAGGAASPRGRVEPPRSPGQPYVYRAVARAVGVAAVLPARGRARQRPLPGRARGRGADRAALGAERAAQTGRRRGARRLCPARRRLPRWPPAPAGGGGRRRARRRSRSSRARVMATEPVLDAREFAPELAGLLRDFRQVTTAEFLITALTVDPGAGCGQRRGALRPRGSRPHGPPRPARRPVADALAEGTVRLARRRVDGPAATPAAAPRYPSSPT